MEKCFVDYRATGLHDVKEIMGNWKLKKNVASKSRIMPPSKFLTLLLIIAFIGIEASFADTTNFADQPAFQAELDRIRAVYNIPGMSAALIIDRQLKSVLVSGVRKYGSDNPVLIDDAFQIGSITKPITATLAYILSKKKILPITTKIVDVFPELKKRMRPQYRKVTVRMLLTHLAAFPYKPKGEGADEFFSITKNLQKRRYEYVKAAVKDKPEGTVGEYYVYSGGTIIAAAMMERVTGKSWEALVKKYVFKPLGMNSAGFGATSKNSDVSGVWEHYMDSSGPVPIEAPARYSTEPHAPAGRNVHVSAGDLAKFMIASFPYRQGEPSVLPRSLLIDMQQKTKYAATSPGWFVGANWWSNWKTVYHYGDNGKSIGAFVFSPKYEFGYVILANIAGEQAWTGVHELGSGIEAYFETILPADTDVPRMSNLASSLTYGKSITASNVFYEMPDYAPEYMLDGNYETRWATDEEAKEAWFEVDLGSVQPIKEVFIKEEFSPRVSSFSILARNDETQDYRSVYSGKEIGDELILHPKPFNARFVRLTMTADLGPTISEFHLFAEKQ